MLKKLLYGVLFLSFICQSQILAKEKIYKWKLAMSWPTYLTPLSSPPLKFAELVNEMSNGKLVIKVHDSNKHKAALGVLDMVKTGSYEMGHSGSFFWKGKDINTLFFSSTPFGMNMSEQYAWFYYGGGLELMQETYKKHKVYSYPGGNTGVQMGGWFKKEINSLQDLKGLKMRIPGFAGEIMAKLGVVVTNIAGGELYTSLDRGTIDAVEWTGPGMDIKMGFHKITPYYYAGWHEPASEMQFLINIKAFEKLPKDLQKIVITAMKATSADMYYENYHENIIAWDKMKKEYPNIQVKQFPKEVLKAMHEQREILINEMEKKGGLTKKIIQSQKDYLKKARNWTKTSEYLYLKNIYELEK